MQAHLLNDRHPSTREIARWFVYDHLRHEQARAVSQQCHDLAQTMIAALPDGPELTTGLRKLLEATDAFVRQALPQPPEVEL